MRQAKRQIDMLQGPLVGKLLMFAIPLALTGILQQLFNAADLAVVGQFAGEHAMAAVGSNAPVIGLLVNLFLGISLGANVVIANATGAGNDELVSEAVHSAILLSLLGGVFVCGLGQLIARPLLTLLAVPPEVMPGAVLYIRIYFAGMPVILLYNFEAAIFRSQGDTRTPLVTLIISGLANVAMNLFFVRVLGMTVDGVALATVLSNLISAVILFLLLLRSESRIRVTPSKLRFSRRAIRMMLKIGIPSGLQSTVFSLSNLVVQSAINSLGATVMAASSAAFNIEVIVFFVGNAFGQACTTFTGQNFGAGQIERCRKVLRRCLILAWIATLILMVSFVFGGGVILKVFNSNPEVVRIGMIRIRALMSGELFMAAIEIISGSLRGFQQSLVPALISFFGICGVRIAWVHLVFARRRTFGVLMSAYPASWVFTVILIALAYFAFHRKRRRLQTEKI